MKFTLSWLKEHLDTGAGAQQVVDAMTMAGLEVEHVEDPATKLAPFSVAKIVEAARHPNADRLQVCQVDTVDGRKEIVCGAPNARAGLTTVYAPIGAYVPGLGVTLVEKPVRGVVSNGMLCSAAELETDTESNGIMELPDDLAVGTPVTQALGLEAVIDFEVTPNRPDWLEILGCGMVHPNVLKNCGLDPHQWQGFAFGLGIDRMAMLKYGVPDLRDMFAADVRWLAHYGFPPFQAPNPVSGLS